MVRTIPEYKRIAEYIAGSFGCSWQDLGSLCHNFTDSEYVEALAGNLPPDMSERLQAYGVKCIHPEGIPGKDPEGIRAEKSEVIQTGKAGSDAEKIQEKPEAVKSTTEKKKAKKEKTEKPKSPGGIYARLQKEYKERQALEESETLERVAGDVIPADMQADGLPDDIISTIQGWIRDFGTVNDIDVNKMDPQQWRACCMYIGHYIKQNGILYDKKSRNPFGSPTYNGKALESLLSVWAYFCGIYKKAPIVPDFINFSGVHKNFFYDYDGQGLTSTAVQLVKKARTIEENGLQANVSGGAPGAVGSMFLLKCRHGYQESPQVVQISPASAPVGGALPVFNSAVGALEDKKP